MDDMVSNHISVSLEMEEDIDTDSAYKTADKVMEAIMKADGVKKVGAMDGNAGVSSGLTGNATDYYSNFTFQVIADDDMSTTNDYKKIIKNI